MTSRAEVVKGLQGIALGRAADDQMTTITFTWPVTEPLIRCGLCFCVIQKADSASHAGWHGRVVHVGPVVEPPAASAEGSHQS